MEIKFSNQTENTYSMLRIKFTSSRLNSIHEASLVRVPNRGVSISLQCIALHCYRKYSCQNQADELITLVFFLAAKAGQ